MIERLIVKLESNRISVSIRSDFWHKNAKTEGEVKY
jgi:hypothetical protein